MKISSKITLPIAAIALVGVGALTAVAFQSHAQDTLNSSANSSSSGRIAQRRMMHAPLGNDGNVTAVNGTTISMQEEADEGGATYTVDTGSATFTKNGASATISDIKVGDKIFVQGTVTGTNVKATSVSDGHPAFGKGMGHLGWFGNQNQTSPQQLTQSQ